MNKWIGRLMICVVGWALSASADVVVQFNGSMVTSGQGPTGDFGLDTSTPKVAASVYGDGSGPDVYGAFYKDTSTNWRVQPNNGNGMGIRVAVTNAHGAALHVFKVDAVSFDGAANVLSASFGAAKPPASYTARYVIEAGGSWYASELSDFTAGTATWAVDARTLDWYDYDPTGASSNIVTVGSLATVTFEDIDFIGFMQEITGPATNVSNSAKINAGVKTFTFNATPSSLDPNIIDQWDMADDGQFQLSHNGTSLGGVYATNNQQVAQTAGDGTFVFSPNSDTATSGALNFSAPMDLTENLVRLSWTFESINWTNTPATNNIFSFRFMVNTAATEYVELNIADVTGDAIWAQFKTTALLGSVGASGNTSRGRITAGNNLELTAPRTITLELDYQDGEIRLSNSHDWNFIPGNGDKTAPVVLPCDFAGNGVTNISQFQNYYANWGTGDQVVMDNLKVEIEPHPYYHPSRIADTVVHPVDSFQTNQIASLAVEAGDYMVVAASLNKSRPEGAVSFSGDATLGDVEFLEASSAATALFWYAPVLSNGTVGVELELVDDGGNAALGTFVSYVVRALNGDTDLLTSSYNTAANGESLTVTNVYDFTAVTNGLVIEACASYANDGNGISPENPDFVEDAVSGGRRIVGYIEFSDLSTMTNVWTATTNRQHAIAGLVFVQGDGTDPIITPESLYADWLEANGYPEGSPVEDYLVEYASGSAANLPVSVEEGGYFIHVHTEWADAATRGLSYELAADNNLVLAPAWSNAVDYVDTAVDTHSAGLNTITNRIDTLDAAEFIRLNVTFTP